MYIHKPEFIPENFLTLKEIIYIENICHITDVAIVANTRVKPKENKNLDKYLDLARELKFIINRTVS